MRPVNLFLTEDGVLKLGYYGLTTQAEYYSIRKTDCKVFYGFAPEVLRGKFWLVSDVWSFGMVLIELMGITPYSGHESNRLDTPGGTTFLPFDKCDIKSRDLVDFLVRCFWRMEGCSVSELMNVSVI